MKKQATFIFLIMFLFMGCQPSEQLIQTAIAQTQVAAPTNTATFIPTLTLTLIPTPTYTPSPTPDLRVIKTDPKELLLTPLDLPDDAKYYLPYSNWITPHRNSEIIQFYETEVGEKYIGETGRIDGWIVRYRRGNGRGVYPKEIYDNVIMYQSMSGAQLFITKYEDSLLKSKFTEVMTRIYIRNDGEQVSYKLVFSYRNYVHRLIAYGLNSEVQPDFIEKIARILLSNLETAPLSSP